MITLSVCEVANVASEASAEVLRGLLRYPSETGGWQLGDLDLSGYLSKYRDCELVLIVEETAKPIRAQKEERATMSQEVERIPDNHEDD